MYVWSTRYCWYVMPQKPTAKRWLGVKSSGVALFTGWQDRSAGAGRSEADSIEADSIVVPDGLVVGVAAGVSVVAGGSIPDVA